MNSWPMLADARIDAVRVWKLDRFGRSLRHLMNALAELEKGLLDNPAKKIPDATLIKCVAAPTVEAQIKISRNNPDRAVEILPCSITYECSDLVLGSCIYPAYIRGQAWLAGSNSRRSSVTQD